MGWWELWDGRIAFIDETFLPALNPRREIPQPGDTLRDRLRRARIRRTYCDRIHPAGVIWCNCCAEPPFTTEGAPV